MEDLRVRQFVKEWERDMVLRCPACHRVLGVVPRVLGVALGYSGWSPRY